MSSALSRLVKYPRPEVSCQYIGPALLSKIWNGDLADLEVIGIASIWGPSPLRPVAVTIQ
jgi:hypothetical protein